jgi:hypothetical protein
MIEDPRDGQAPALGLSRPRPRFSLKAIFVVMTIACLLLGWTAARRFRAADIVARNHAVLDVIEQNLSTEPDKTSFVFSETLRQRSISFRQRTRQDPNQQIKQLSRITSGGPFYQMASFNEPLVVADLLQGATPSAVSVQIMKHYERGLAELGFHKTVQSGGTDRETAIWQRNDHGMHIIIDVDVRPTTSTANVRIIFLHNERISVW